MYMYMYISIKCSMENTQINMPCIPTCLTCNGEESRYSQQQDDRSIQIPTQRLLDEYGPSIKIGLHKCHYMRAVSTQYSVLHFFSVRSILHVVSVISVIHDGISNTLHVCSNSYVLNVHVNMSDL